MMLCVIRFSVHRWAFILDVVRLEMAPLKQRKLMYFGVEKIYAIAIPSRCTHPLAGHAGQGIGEQDSQDRWDGTHAVPLGGSQHTSVKTTLSLNSKKKARAIRFWESGRRSPNTRKACPVKSGFAMRAPRRPIRLDTTRQKLSSPPRT